MFTPCVAATHRSTKRYCNRILIRTRAIESLHRNPQRLDFFFARLIRYFFFLSVHPKPNYPYAGDTRDRHFIIDLYIYLSSYDALRRRIVVNINNSARYTGAHGSFVIFYYFFCLGVI